MITVNRKDLSTALASVKPAVNKRSQLPILTCALLTGTPDTLTVATTDLELYASNTIPAHGDTDTRACLDFAALEAALKAGKADSVSIECNRTHATVTNGTARASVPLMDADEYPGLPVAPADPDGRIVVDLPTFADTFNRIALAASTDEERPVLTGVHMRYDDKAGLHVEAANGFVLLRTIYTPQAHSDTFECLPPARLGKLLAKMRSTHASILLDTSRNVLHVIGCGEHVTTHLINGGYPDLTTVIPVNPQHAVSFLADAALDAIRQYKPVMGITRLRYTADGALEFAIRNEDHNMSASVPCELLSEEPADLAGFNPDYLRMALKAVARKGEHVTVTMECTIPVMPPKFTTDSDPSFIGVVMPMYIAD